MPVSATVTLCPLFSSSRTATFWLMRLSSASKIVQSSPGFPQGVDRDQRSGFLPIGSSLPAPGDGRQKIGALDSVSTGKRRYPTRGSGPHLPANRRRYSMIATEPTRGALCRTRSTRPNPSSAGHRAHPAGPGEKAYLARAASCRARDGFRLILGQGGIHLPAHAASPEVCAGWSHCRLRPVPRRPRSISTPTGSRFWGAVFCEA